MSPSVDDGLRVTVTCQRVFTCGTNAPSVRDADNRGGCVYVGGGAEELTVLSTQFCFEPETDLKIKY